MRKLNTGRCFTEGAFIQPHILVHKAFKFYSLRPCDVTGHYRAMSTPNLVKACCLKTPKFSIDPMFDVDSLSMCSSETHDLSRGLPTRKFNLLGYLCFCAFLKWIVYACNYVSIYWCWINSVRVHLKAFSSERVSLSKCYIFKNYISKMCLFPRKGYQDQKQICNTPEQ